MQPVRIAGLPDDPLAAAARFHAELVPALPTEGDVLLVFAPAEHPHRGWREAAVGALGRAFAPRRINAVASDNPAAVDSALAYLATAQGLTGQYLPLDDAGAGAVLPSGA